MKYQKPQHTPFQSPQKKPPTFFQLTEHAARSSAARKGWSNRRKGGK